MIDLEKLREQAPYVGLIDDELIELLDHIAQLEKDAERWNMIPAVAEDHQINLMQFYRDIDTAMEAKHG